MRDFPIPKLERLPTRITPCPILEAVLEIRFVTGHDWALLPGLLFNQIRDRYPKLETLPISQLPDDVLKGDPDFTYQPRVRFNGDGFVIQFGPRVVSLITQGNYPGWRHLSSEVEWLLGRLEEARFIHEGERIGMRYIDFFAEDIFPHLVIGIRADGEPVEGFDMSFTTAFCSGDFNARLILNNGALVTRPDGVIRGSILDLDLGLESSAFDVFENSLERFEEAHRRNKEIFFGLLKPEFLGRLSPKYQ